MYNPASNSWSYTGRLNQARRGATVLVLPDGRVMVIGGSYGLPTRDRFQGTCELFDPDTGQWRYTQGQLGIPREAALAVLLPNETILIAGGEGSHGGVTSSAERYHIKTDTFSSAGFMPGKR